MNGDIAKILADSRRLRCRFHSLISESRGCEWWRSHVAKSDIFSIHSNHHGFLQKYTPKQTQVTGIYPKHSSIRTSCSTLFGPRPRLVASFISRFPGATPRNAAVVHARNCSHRRTSRTSWRPSRNPSRTGGCCSEIGGNEWMCFRRWQVPTGNGTLHDTTCTSEIFQRVKCQRASPLGSNRIAIVVKVVRCVRMCAILPAL